VRSSSFDPLKVIRGDVKLAKEESYEIAGTSDSMSLCTVSKGDASLMLEAKRNEINDGIKDLKGIDHTGISTSKNNVISTRFIVCIPPFLKFIYGFDKSLTILYQIVSTDNRI